jgi:hypothetical protein
MKAQIRITGQISGNFQLRSALDNGTSTNGMFNSFTIYFDTINEAKKAIREGWSYLKRANDELPWNSSKSTNNTSIRWDASKAELITQ